MRKEKSYLRNGMSFADRVMLGHRWAGRCMYVLGWHA